MKRLIPFTLCLLLIACGQKKQQSESKDSTVVVNITHNPTDQLNASDFIDSVRYVKLETTDDAAIARISKVLVTDSLLMVADRKSAAVFIFDTNGKYLRKIAKQGRGPKEYIDFTNVFLSYDQMHIMIRDLVLKSLIFYNLNGEFVKSISDFADGNWVEDLIQLPNGNFLCYRGTHSPSEPDQGGLFEVDSSGKVIQYLIKYDFTHPDISSQRLPGYLYRLTDGRIGLYPLESEDIYYYDGKTLQKYLSYTTYFKTAKDAKVSYNKAEERLGWRLISHEKGGYIFSIWIDDQSSQYMSSLYSKKKKTHVVTRDINYDIPNMIANLHGDGLYSNLENVIIMPADAERIFLILNDDQYLNQANAKAAFEKITHGMSKTEIENMNPVLEFLYIKK